MRLRDKVAIVTGAGRGIGRAVAARFAAEGARVVVADLDASTGGAVVEEIQVAGSAAHFYRCDVSREDQVQGMVDFALEQFGRIEILVNNAICSIDEILDNAWAPTMDVAVKGTWLCCQAVLPTMVDQRAGSIVNLSSINALMGFGTDYVYTAAKGAIVSLTRCLATQYGKHNVRLNVLCPGSTQTEIWAPCSKPIRRCWTRSQSCTRWVVWRSLRRSPVPRFSWRPTRRRSLPVRSWSPTAAPRPAMSRLTTRGPEYRPQRTGLQGCSPASAETSREPDRKAGVKTQGDSSVQPEVAGNKTGSGLDLPPYYAAYLR